MSSSTFKHNKKRNTGLVYEFLVRRAGLAMVDRDPDSYLNTIGIIKKYYAPGTPLSHEKEVFDVIARSRGLTENSAHHVLEEARKHVTNLDSRKIEIKKSNLIKDIHYAFGQDFFDVHRIPEYRLMASIQMLIEQYKMTSKSITEGVQKIELEESLIKYMCSTPTASAPVVRGEKIDGLVATLAMKKFEERYAGSLNEGQKKVLRRFMNYSMTKNDEQFTREMEEERSKIVKTLTESRNLQCFVEDGVMKQRLDEALTTLKNMKIKGSPERSVEELLLFHKLVQEVKSDE